MCCINWPNCAGLFPHNHHHHNGKVRITPIVIGAVGTFSNNMQKYLENLHIGLSIQTLQKSVLLGSAGILRKTLER